ncbi:MAG: glycoside hydrolase family 15 protein [Mycobacteriales bacterium]|nr:MAG: glycosyl hydrolase family 15 [Pseudonocardiales bacterium]
MAGTAGQAADPAAQAGDYQTGTSPFPPIADFAFLSDCQFSALVAPNGAVEWMCLPRPDSPSIFGALLDRAAGSFRLGPEDVMIPAGQRYLPGTNILETTWQTRTGWVIVRDFLAVGPWYQEQTRSQTHRRTPTDYDAEHTLIRLVHCQHGTVDLTMECEPVFNYGRTDARWQYTGDTYGDATATAPDIDLTLRIRTDMRVGFEGRRAGARTRLREGDHHFVAFSWSDHDLPETYADAHDMLIRTSEFWRLWLGRGNFPDHPWRIYLQRSALTLKGLTYAPTGALLAAATTSLPETPGGSRNWDYRYSWVRDSAFTLWGLYELGFDDEADDFFYFIADVCEDADLQVLYRVDGERKLEEQTLDHLGGYEGAKPVRIGNGAYSQAQHDMWGTVLDSVYLHTRSRDYLPERVWPILSRQVEEALAHWREPDRGIWEMRGEPQHFTASKVMCWVAADRGARLATMRGDAEQAARWSAAAQEIHADVCANGVDDRGVFTQHYGASNLDASLLLLPLVRFLPSDDARIRATVLAIADELSVDGMVLRYKTEETDDGLSGEEGAFLICSFWLVSALVEIGEVDRGRHMCERLLSYASSLHLYSEEIDTRNGRYLGNFPQAFTHLALINAVLHVVDAEQPGAR